MSKSRALIFIALLKLSVAYGQIADPSFANYLLKKGNYSDITLIKQLDMGHNTTHQLDSLNYYFGWAYHNLQDLEKSNTSFLSVSPESAFYNSSRFFACWNHYYLGKPDQGLNYLSQIKPASNVEKELHHMFTLSGKLLQRHTVASDSLLSFIGESQLIYLPQWERMKIHNTRLAGFEPKSFALAGALSGILPGLGKIYTRQKGAGVSSFLTVGTMAVITIENGIKTGWQRWNTIIAAGIFSLFYVGNVYGSIVSVKIYRQRFLDEIDRAILLDINIPLRNIYR